MRIAPSESRAVALPQPPVSTGAPPAVAPAVPAAARPDEPSPFAQLLHGIGRALANGEATMHHAMRAAQGGHDMGPAELIALQAGVYRYSEAIDLASHLVDRTTNGVKTVIQGSGQ
jgi:hypothetical protein